MRRIFPLPFSPRSLTIFVFGLSSIAGLACRTESPSTPPATTTQPSEAQAQGEGHEGEAGHEHGEDHEHSGGVWTLVDDPHDESQVEALMGGMAKALGADCDFCHRDDDHARHHMKLAGWMAENLVGLVDKESGKAVGCNDCHQGKGHIFPGRDEEHPELRGVLTADIKEGDKDALKARMKAISDALGVKCDYCHDTSDFSKTSRNQQIAAWMQVNFVDRLHTPDGKELSCEGCHQGKAKIMP